MDQRLVKASIRLQARSNFTCEEYRNQLAQAIGLAMMDEACVAIEHIREPNTGDDIFNAACWATALPNLRFV